MMTGSSWRVRMYVLKLLAPMWIHAGHQLAESCDCGESMLFVSFFIQSDWFMIAVNHSHPWLRRHVGTTVSQINGCILKPGKTTTATTASRQEIMVATKENSVIHWQHRWQVASLSHWHSTLWRLGHRCRGHWNQSHLEFYVYLYYVYGLYQRWVII